MARYRVLALCSSVTLAGSVAHAQVVTPIQRADLVNVQMTGTASYDAEAGFNTYSYVIRNGNGAQQDVSMIFFETGAELLAVRSPKGWTFASGGRNGGRCYASWAATELAPAAPSEEDDGGVPESPFAIKPGEILSGFSFKSFAPPGSVAWFAQGYVPIPQAADPEDFITEGYDPALLDFRQNSDTGSVEGPVAACASGVHDGGTGAVDSPAD